MIRCTNSSRERLRVRHLQRLVPPPLGATQGWRGNSSDSLPGWTDGRLDHSRCLEGGRRGGRRYPHLQVPASGREEQVQVQDQGHQQDWAFGTYRPTRNSSCQRSLGWVEFQQIYILYENNSSMNERMNERMEDNLILKGVKEANLSMNKFRRGKNYA